MELAVSVDDHQLSRRSAAVSGTQVEETKLGQRFQRRGRRKITAERRGRNTADEMFV